jgi:TRAP-type C4-dicarboxylate transport system substrate-binding protein
MRGSMLKNKNLMLLGLLCLFMVVLVACSNDDDSSKVDGESPDSAVATNAEVSGEIQEVKAKLAHFYSPDIFTYEGYELFSDLVSEKSAGKIQFTIFPAGQLYNDANLPTAISSGQVELGVTVAETWASNIAALEFNTLPIYKDTEHFRNALNNGIREIVSDQLAAINVKPLIWTYFDFSYFASSKSALVSPEDFVNKKIRTTGPLMAKFVELSGGTPVSVPAVDVPQALQRGTVDASVSGVTGFQSWRYYEYTDYYSGPFNPGLVLLSANTKWWNSLNEATKNVILEAAKETEDFLIKSHDKVTVEAKTFLAEQGMKYEGVDLTQFSDAIAALKEQYLSNAGEAGQQIIDIVESSE